MSDHDPFDGNYDDTPAQPEPQDDGKSEVTVVADDDVDVNVVHEGDQQPRHLGKTELARMDKADLQAAARERGLSDTGNRTELIEAIHRYQGD